MRYEDYLKTDHWRSLRDAKLLDADDRCQKCKKRSKLQVHHLNYERLGNELLSDLQVLCEKCHQKSHNIFPEYVDDWKFVMTPEQKRLHAKYWRWQEAEPAWKKYFPDKPKGK